MLNLKLYIGQTTKPIEKRFMHGKIGITSESITGKDFMTRWLKGTFENRN